MTESTSQEQPSPKAEYKGYVLNPVPRQTPNGKWLPYVVISLWEEDNFRTTTPIGATERVELDTRDEAVQVSFQLGITRVDQGIDWSK